MKFKSLRSIIMTFWTGLVLAPLTFPLPATGAYDPIVEQKYHFYADRLQMHSYYHVFAYSGNGDEIQLFDNSRWSVHPHDQSKVIYWRKSHDIFIKPAYSWIWPSLFFTYNYVLYNRNLNEAAGVKLILRPLPMCENTFLVENIDPFQKIVILNDNTCWQMDPYDSDLSNWKRGQRILVGVNNKWHTDPYPQILINIDLHGEPYQKAIFYSYL